jgi:hypothetical protein
MPTRKQRRRRQKDFRHDVRVFEVDEEGNEVPIAELREREEKARPAPAKQAKKGGGGATRGRPVRDVQPPSWQRAIRRGGLMGGAMLLAMLFLFKSAPIGYRVMWGLIYAVGFIPLTYIIDRTAYRSFQKRVAKKT